MMQKRRLIDHGKVVLSVAVAVFAVQLLIGCEEPTGPDCQPECGTCNTAWDSKAQVCRDLGKNVIVPASCCGY
jgi:hypothetical protein